MKKTDEGAVLVLGAHPDASRFAHRAMTKLEAHGFDPVPLNPRFADVLGRKCFSGVGEWRRAHPNETVSTLTVYLNPVHSSKIQDELIALKAKRVIFNPGAENPALARELRKAGTEVVEACTLVLLDLGNF
jgi:predicted CoA-binding protein